MPDDVKEIESGKVKKKGRRFDQRDFDHIAEFVMEEQAGRKKRRADREKHWKEIDRQIAMEPDITHKLDGKGNVDIKKKWMSEVELPLQAQALEVLTADVRRMLFPDSGPWFRAHAETTDDYLANLEQSDIVLGTSDLASAGAGQRLAARQDNADQLAIGFALHLFRQGDFLTRMDKINAEALKYGMGIGRARLEKKQDFIHEARGTMEEDRAYPAIAPMGVKNVYLDDQPPSFLTSTALSPAPIAEAWIKLENLQIAASRGSSDPEDEDGGWMAGAVQGLEPTKDGTVHLLEMEGDIVIPRKTVRSFVIPGAVVTVAVGGSKGGKTTKGVVRLRFRKKPFSSYLNFPYHYEGAGQDDIYPASPIMKGRPVQIMASQALNRLLDSAALKNGPPVGYDSDDTWFAQEGGPVIHPNAMWKTTGDVKVYAEIGGDQVALSGALSLALNLYAELTGVLPARIGAQTVSHTTAFAKDAEIQRGAVRTVDYASQIGQDTMTRWLNSAYIMGREALGNKKISLYIAEYDGFVRIGREHLPENVFFQWFGSAGPQEAARRAQNRLQSMQVAIQLDQLLIQRQQEPNVDIAAAQRETLREGDWTDIDSIIPVKTAPGGDETAPAVPAAPGGNRAPALAPVQAIGG